MNRILLSVVSLSLTFGTLAFAADKIPAPKAACPCASHTEKCAGACCSACRGGEACSCAVEGCKACPKCSGKTTKP